MCSLTVSKIIYFPFSTGLVSMGNVISANVNLPQNVSLSERFATENYLGGKKHFWAAQPESTACSPALLALLSPSCPM